MILRSRKMSDLIKICVSFRGKNFELKNILSDFTEARSENNSALYLS